ncbi:MAG: two-component sensor histidine kinase [Acidobacteria bacterium]|nr:two-component sensor histidine kinase [Acidobacteriota bacterium]
MWTRVLIRPAQAIVAVLLSGCLIAIIGLSLLAVQARSRLHTMRERGDHTSRMLRLGLRAQESFLEHPGDREVVDPVIIEELRQELRKLRASGRALDPANDERLLRLTEILESDDEVSRNRLIEIVATMGNVLRTEATAQNSLWDATERAASRELALAVGICGVVPLLVVVMWWIRRRWIASPLDDLRRLLTELGSGDRHRVSVEAVHPSLTPLFTNYNELVRRLDELEAIQRSHTANLEAEIRTATETLLEQQSTLARAERLAAVGETTANLAHELRNPLAGILMSLGNLRRETTDADMTERLDLVIAEIERLTRLLNQALEAARHRPEPPRKVNLRELVTNLLNLMRYQIPDRIVLECTIDDDLHCNLPQDRVRQALLNLILNSVQAVGREPAHIAIGAKRENGNIEVTVCDDGPGFSNEILTGGVRKFATGGSGTGLGLAMVRRVAADLGGEIKLTNMEPHGACVRLIVECCNG